MIYHHFTTIGAETGSLRAFRTVFSERGNFARKAEKVVRKFTIILKKFTTIWFSNILEAA